MSDTEPVKHTTISVGFNVEVTDAFCGYVRLLHLDITIWTVTFTHWTCNPFCFRLVKKSGHGFILGSNNDCTFLCCVHPLSKAQAEVTFV